VPRSFINNKGEKMKDLIEIFKMNELSVQVRINLLIKLGRAINYEYGTNFTEPVVLELVRILDPNHPVCSDKHYLSYSGE
jgi:hypothetical protein